MASWPTSGDTCRSNPHHTNASIAKWAANSSGTDANGQSWRSRTWRIVSTPTTPTATAPATSAWGEKHIPESSHAGRAQTGEPRRPARVLCRSLIPAHPSTETGHPTSVRRSAGSSASATR